AGSSTGPTASPRTWAASAGRTTAPPRSQRAGTGGRPGRAATSSAAPERPSPGPREVVELARLHTLDERGELLGREPQPGAVGILRVTYQHVPVVRRGLDAVAARAEARLLPGQLHTVAARAVARLD